MSSTHILTTATPSTSTSTTLKTTSHQPQPQPSPTPTLASLPLQTPDSKWRIHSAGCKPTCSFPPLQSSTPPLIHAAAIQIPGSQWRLALKTKASLKTPNTPSNSPASSTLSTSSQPPETPRLGKALPISSFQNSSSSLSHQSSLADNTNSLQINSDTQTGPPERKRTYLDALKYENAIRMQLTIKPNCTKLERKMGYLRRWKERWAKFDGLRRVLGCVSSDVGDGQACEGEGRVEGGSGGGGGGGEISYEVGRGGAIPIRNVEQMIDLSHGDWRTILWPSRQDFSLAPDKNHKMLTGSRTDHEERLRGGRRWLDELEREWWGDGFPIVVHGGDRGEGWECWLDEVD